MVAFENTVTSQWALVMYAADFSLGGYQCTLSFISTVTSSCLPVSENLTVFFFMRRMVAPRFQTYPNPP